MQHQTASVHLTLPLAYVQQIRDELALLIEEWEYTADVMQSGRVRDDLVSHACHDEAEAHTVAEDYRRILREIESQLSA